MVSYGQTPKNARISILVRQRCYLVAVYGHSFQKPINFFFSACFPPPVLRTNPLKKDTGRYAGSQVLRCEPPPTPPVPMVRSTFVRGTRFSSLSFPSFSALSLSPESPPFFAVFSRGFLIRGPPGELFCSGNPQWHH